MKFLDTYGILKDLNPELGEFIDPRDGQKYQTIKIGDIEWFRENLNYDETDEIGGSTLLDIFDIEPMSLKQDSVKDDVSCGRYYSFNSAKFACPKGWEIPKRNVWIDLFIRITGKNPNEWGNHEKHMIYNTLVGPSSILNLKHCGKYESRKDYGIWGSSRIAREYTETVLIRYSILGAYLTFTPSAIENGGSIFCFNLAERSFSEEVGHGKYTVRPIRKNI
jgi:uncharacterized protein (TIGR02145 family)